MAQSAVELLIISSSWTLLLLLLLLLCCIIQGGGYWWWWRWQLYLKANSAGQDRGVYCGVVWGEVRWGGDWARWGYPPVSAWTDSLHWGPWQCMACSIALKHTGDTRQHGEYSGLLHTTHILPLHNKVLSQEDTKTLYIIYMYHIY